MGFRSGSQVSRLTANLDNGTSFISNHKRKYEVINLSAMSLSPKALPACWMRSDSSNIQDSYVPALPAAFILAPSSPYSRASRARSRWCRKASLLTEVLAGAES